MKEHSGDNLELGPSKPSGQWHEYTYIKIGSEILKKVYIQERLNNVLRDQTRRDGGCKLWVTKWFFRPLIIGITQDDGQTFRQNVNSAYFTIASAIALILFCAGYYGASSLPYTLAIAVLPVFVSYKLIERVRQVKADHVY